MNSIPLQYSIVQYFDDPMRDEPRNIGVVLRDPRDNYVVTKFLKGRDLKAKLGTLAAGDLPLVQTYINHIESMLSSAKNFSRELKLSLSTEGLAATRSLGDFGKVKLVEARGVLTSDPQRESEYLFQTFVLPKEGPKRERLHQFKVEIKNALSKKKLLKRTPNDRNPGFTADAVIKSARSKVEHQVDFLRTAGVVTVLETVDLRKRDRTETEHGTFEAAFKLQDLRQGYGKGKFRGFSLVTGVGTSDEKKYCLNVLRAYSEEVVDFSSQNDRERFLVRLQSETY